MLDETAKGISIHVAFLRQSCYVPLTFNSFLFSRQAFRAEHGRWPTKEERVAHRCAQIHNNSISTRIQQASETRILFHNNNRIF